MENIPARTKGNSIRIEVINMKKLFIMFASILFLNSAAWGFWGNPYDKIKCNPYTAPDDNYRDKCYLDLFEYTLDKCHGTGHEGDAEFCAIYAFKMSIYYMLRYQFSINPDSKHPEIIYESCRRSCYSKKAYDELKNYIKNKRKQLNK